MMCLGMGDRSVGYRRTISETTGKKYQDINLFQPVLISDYKTHPVIETWGTLSSLCLIGIEAEDMRCQR